MAAIAIVIVMMAVLWLLSNQCYYIVEAEKGADLYWNSDEAYIFIGVSRVGWIGTRAEWLMQVFPDKPAATNRNGTQQSSVLVLRINENGVTQTPLQNSELGVYHPYLDHLYKYGDKTLSRLSGGQFVRVEPAEEDAFLAAKRPSGEYTNSNGWSRRCCVLQRGLDHRVFVQLANVTFAVHVTVQDNGKSMDLERSGQDPQRVWSIDSKMRAVSREEYDSTFNHAASGTPFR